MSETLSFVFPKILQFVPMIVFICLNVVSGGVTVLWGFMRF